VVTRFTHYAIIIVVTMAQRQGQDFFCSSKNRPTTTSNSADTEGSSLKGSCECVELYSHFPILFYFVERNRTFVLSFLDKS
jgi:hypothetical protein